LPTNQIQHLKENRGRTRHVPFAFLLRRVRCGGRAGRGTAAAADAGCQDLGLMPGWLIKSSGQYGH